jgi:GTP-sensing pleiotropic transcriptional regulator CodY
MKLTDSEKHYIQLSEIYLLKYQEMVKPQKDIMVAKGIIVEMMSELLQFSMKNPENEKAKKSQERLDSFMDIINLFSQIADNNYQISLLYQNQIRQSIKLKETINQLQKEIMFLKHE